MPQNDGGSELDNFFAKISKKKSIEDTCRMERIESPSLAALRCQDLLRQLGSRLGALEYSAPSERSIQSGNERRHKRESAGTSEPHGRSKRARITYATRMQRSGTGATATHGSTVTFRDAKTNRQSIHPSDSVGNQERFLMDEDIVSQPNTQEVVDSMPRSLRVDLDRYRHKQSTSRYFAYRGLFEWLARLIRLTRNAKGDAHGRSLLAMCLRRTPESFEQMGCRHPSSLAARTGQHGRWSSGRSLEPYSQLDTLGLGFAGWRLLKHAIRAHSLLLLRREIARGLLEPMHVHFMVRLLSHHGYFREATDLVLAIPGPFPPPRHTSSQLDESNRLLPLHTLLSFALHKEKPTVGFVLYCVSKLVSEKRLPISWWSTTPFQELLAMAVRLIGRGQPGPWATELVEAVIDSYYLGTRKRITDSYREYLDRCEGLISLAANLSVAATHSTTNNAKDPLQHANSRNRLMHTLDVYIGRSKKYHFNGWNGHTVHLEIARLLCGIDREEAQNMTRVCPGIEIQPLLQFLDSSSNRVFRSSALLIVKIAHDRNLWQGCSNGGCLEHIPKDVASLSLPDSLQRDTFGSSFDSLNVHSNEVPGTGLNNHELRWDRLVAKRGSTMAWVWEESIREFVKQSPVSKRVNSKSRLANLDSSQMMRYG